MESQEKLSVFETLNKLDCTEHIDKRSSKDGELSYLSWPWAWAEVKKRYPDASYTIYRDEHNRPFVEDPDFGIMCYTTVTIEGQTLEMWLPVMDGANRAMRRVPYTYQTKKGEGTVNAATMFDINKTIMRCLVKNLAMFGIGLYIYAGEDLPEADTSLVDKLIEQMNAAPTKEEANKIWRDNAKLQTNVKFKETAMKVAKKFNAAPQPQAAQSQQEEQQ